MSRFRPPPESFGEIGDLVPGAEPISETAPGPGLTRARTPSPIRNMRITGPRIGVALFALWVCGSMFASIGRDTSTQRQRSDSISAVPSDRLDYAPQCGDDFDCEVDELLDLMDQTEDLAWLCHLVDHESFSVRSKAKRTLADLGAPWQATC